MAWLHLAVLWAFAIAKPLLDVLADEPAFFVARGNTRADLLIFAIGLMALPPTLLVAVEALAFRSERLRSAVHWLFVGGLVAAFALQVLVDEVSASSRVIIPVAAAIGAAGAVVYARWPAVRSVLTVLSPAPLLFLVFFLLFSPVHKLILPQDEAGAAGVGVANTPVVMLVFDEFSGTSLMNASYEIDARRLPNFARLAQESTWYRNATTVADVTQRALPAILTGDYPSPDKSTPPTASEYPDNLFSLLGRSHTLDVYESATRLCSDDLCGDRTESTTRRRLSSLVHDLTVVSLHQLVPNDLDKKLPAVDQTFANFRSGDQVQSTGSEGIPNQAFVNRHATFEKFVAGLGNPTRRPPLHFFHAQLPHIPYQYLPSGQQYPITGPQTPGLGGVGDQVWTRNAAVVREAQRRYLLQESFVDRLLGQVMRRLHKTGQWDRSLVIVTADHGVSFHPGGNRRLVNHDNLGDIVGVPLFIKRPGQRSGHRDDSVVRNVDLVPTIASYLETKLPWDAVGKPVESSDAGRSGHLTFRSFDSGTLSLPVEGFLRSRDASAQALATALRGNDAAYTLGPGGDLVGRGVRSFASGQAMDATVDFDAPGLYSSVNPSAGVVPALITGRIHGSVDAAQPLAVAVNGRISAVTGIYDFDGESRFAAMVPPDVFLKGRNSVNVFAVENSGRDTRLASLGVGREAKLARNGSRDQLELPSKKVVEVRNGAVAGYVDQVTHQGAQVTIAGWAVDTSAKRIPDQVFVFSSGRLLVAGPLAEARPDIADRYGEFARTSGFRLQAATSGGKVSDLRVIAVSGDRAADLQISGGAELGGE